MFIIQLSQPELVQLTISNPISPSNSFSFIFYIPLFQFAICGNGHVSEFSFDDQDIYSSSIAGFMPELTFEFYTNDCTMCEAYLQRFNILNPCLPETAFWQVQSYQIVLCKPDDIFNSLHSLKVKSYYRLLCKVNFIKIVLQVDVLLANVIVADILSF